MKNHLKCIILHLMKLLLLALLFMLSSCSTSLSYNANLYQDGKTLGENKFKLSGAWAIVPTVGSTLNFPFQPNHEGYGLRTRVNHVPMSSTSLRYGLLQKLDIGGDAFFDLDLSMGYKIYLK